MAPDGTLVDTSLFGGQNWSRMTALQSGQTLRLPRAAGRTSSSRESPTGLPADLLSQSGWRLRIVALVYAFVFFMAGFFPALLFQRIGHSCSAVSPDGARA